MNIEHDETIDFNSHPHEEDDADNYILYAVWENFNSHPHEEDDAKNTCDIVNAIISTHILTKRMTVRLLDMRKSHIHFNSHPHEEDDDG